jgi:hypothetical protein
MPRKERRAIQDWVLSDLRGYAKAKSTPPLYKLMVLTILANHAGICNVPVVLPASRMKAVAEPEFPELPPAPSDDPSIKEALEQFNKKHGGDDANNS